MTYYQLIINVDVGKCIVSLEKLASVSQEAILVTCLFPLLIISEDLRFGVAMDMLCSFTQSKRHVISSFHFLNLRITHQQSRRGVWKLKKKEREILLIKIKDKIITKGQNQLIIHRGSHYTITKFSYLIITQCVLRVISLLKGTPHNNVRHVGSS